MAIILKDSVAMELPVYGKCSICNKYAQLNRTYFHYDIKCECHSPHHFDLVEHCKDCIPRQPKETKIILKVVTQAEWRDNQIDSIIND
jgi:hypothetical protein